MINVIAYCLFFITSLYGVASKEYVISLRSDAKLADISLQCIPQPTLLQQCIFSNDREQNDELRYLLAFKENTIITAEQLYVGLERLRNKNTFESIRLSCIHDVDGVNITFYVEKDWTIQSIKVAGVSLGKQAILTMYGFKNGERFSKTKHEHALREITDDFHKKGYMDAVVESFFEYDAHTKQIGITLLVTKGRMYFIDDVIVQKSHNNNESSLALYALIQKYVTHYFFKKPYSEDLIIKKIDQLKKILLHNGFIYVSIKENISINHSTHAIQLTLTVSSDECKKIIFYGNSFFSTDALMNKIMECTHAIGVVPKSMLVEELVELYKSKGFFSADITIKNENGLYPITISEGMRSKIVAIHFKGVSEEHEKKIYKHFFHSLVYTYADTKKIHSALQKCIQWYKKEGFWNVKIFREKYIFTKDKHLILECIIDEGSQRLMSDIEVEGFPSFEPRILELPSLHFDVPMPLSESLLLHHKNSLEKECRKQGYMAPSIDYLLIEKDGLYKVIWHINCGEKLIVDTTIFKGSAINFQKLVHFLPYTKGDVWHKEYVQKMYESFHKMNIFKSVSIQQMFNKNNPDMCDILINVEDDDPFELKLRCGFQQISKNFAFKKGSSFKIGGGLIWKNPFQRLDNIIIDAIFSRFERRAYIAYKQPLFFNIPLETLIKAYSNSFLNPVTLGSRKILYTSLQDGILFGLTHKQNKIEIGMTTGFEGIKINNISVRLAESLRFFPRLINERVPYWFIEPTMYLNYLDNVLNPQSGHYFMWSLKTFIPLDERASSELKLLTECGMYRTYHSITCGGRIKFGYIFLQDFETIMPIERFYLGGANSLRAYQPDKCPPLGTYVDEEGNVEWIAQGGKGMINMNFEVRCPLPVDHLQAALFQDFGILAPNVYDFFKGFFPLAATGFGVRYVTPVGPLRFDIGWKWKKQYEQDTSYAWFLTFGYAF